jgi:hypothetical protein
LEKNGLTWWSETYSSDFIDIDSSIPVFNNWEANEHLRRLVEVDGEEGGR